MVDRLFSGSIALPGCLLAGFRHHLPTALGLLGLRLDMLDTATGDAVVDTRVLSFHGFIFDSECGSSHRRHGQIAIPTKRLHYRRARPPRRATLITDRSNPLATYRGRLSPVFPQADGIPFRTLYLTSAMGSTNHCQGLWPPTFQWRFGEMLRGCSAIHSPSAPSPNATDQPADTSRHQDRPQRSIAYELLAGTCDAADFFSSLLAIFRGSFAHLLKLLLGSVAYRRTHFLKVFLHCFRLFAKPVANGSHVCSVSI